MVTYVTQGTDTTELMAVVTYVTQGQGEKNLIFTSLQGK